MENELQYPGIYVDETSLLPKSVVQVETAVPAFIGYTEKAFFNDVDLHAGDRIRPLEINSFCEFETIFGNAPQPAKVEFQLNSSNSILSLRTEEKGFLYYSVKLFFENGGITCLIVSVGSYISAEGKVSKHRLLKGLACLEKTDAPTLLVMPDAALLPYAEAGELHAAMLHQSEKLKNRFALLDLVNGSASLTGAEKPVDNFRQNVGSKSLSFGAAYYPWLVTEWRRKTGSNALLSATYHQNGIEIKDPTSLFTKDTIDLLKKSVLFTHMKSRLKQHKFHPIPGTKKTVADAAEFYDYLRDFFNLFTHDAVFHDADPFTALHKKYVAKGSVFHVLVKSLLQHAAANRLPLQAGNFIADFSPLTFTVRPAFNKLRSRGRKKFGSVTLKSLILQAEQLVNSFFNDVENLQLRMLEQLKQHDKMYDEVVKALETQNLIVPPGGAVAGITTRIDRQKGVWKAPANVSLSSVIRPAVNLVHHHQEIMNVDAVSGKSVNAVRFFDGVGATLWGARTLAGNDNEWRYIHVRRFCIMVEESIIEAIRPFSFEPNNEKTWIRVRRMVTDFLDSLWRAGALQGTKPQEAYFVKLDSGVSMSASDLDNGVMIIKAGLAVVKPAEFITLSVSQKTLVS